MRSSFAIFLILLTALAASGCNPKTTSDELNVSKNGLSRQSSKLIQTIVDDRGKTFTITSEPKRIVSLTPSGTEILFALGLGDRVVGVTRWCDYPADAKSRAQVGDVNISVEKVVSLEPDLVLAHATLNDSVIRQLERLGKTVIALDPSTIEEVRLNISLVGQACGRTLQADDLNSRNEAIIEQVSEISKGKAGLRTMVVIQPNPLWVAGPNTFIDEMLSICNAQNIAHDARKRFNTFPVERALARDPEVIIVGRDNERDFFLNSPVWKNTSAVRSGRVVVINPDLLVRPGPRLTEGLEKLAEAVDIDD